MPLTLPLLLLAAAALPRAAAAQEPAPQATPQSEPQEAQEPAPSAAPSARIDPLRAAELLMTSGHPEDAHKLLVALETERPNDPQVQFLLAMLAMQDKRYEEAERRFRTILVTEPNNVRVRLELGRTYFLAGDYGNAERQFRFARAGKLPPAVLTNIDRFLIQIRQLKRLSLNFSIAIAPDTNLNAGPSIDAINLYGLPFELSGDAKRNSGVGLAVSGSVEWTAPVAKGTKVRAGMDLQRSQYSQTEFDDMTLSTYVGLSRTFTRWDASLLPMVQRRWYGDRVYMNGYGATGLVNWYPATRAAISANVSLMRRDYPNSDFQSGFGIDLGLGARYTPTTSSLVGVNLGYGHQDARIAAFASHYERLGLSYVREFKGGITASIAPSFTAIDYEGLIPAFGAIRRDRQSTIQLGLLYRRIDIHGFTPRISYTYTHNASNLALYRFDRNRFELGITRSF